MIKRFHFPLVKGFNSTYTGNFVVVTVFMSAANVEWSTDSIDVFEQENWNAQSDEIKAISLKNRRVLEKQIFRSTSCSNQNYAKHIEANQNWI